MHRRLICCVLAIEIAEHARKPLFEQIRITQDLRRLLVESAARVPAEDMIAIGREDGALLGFVADPAACFTAALAVRDAFLEDERYRALQPRIGIDLGRVELIEDEETGALRLGGDGRRDAERLMRRSPPGQVSVSRSFFELLCREAPELTGRLKDQGLLTDTDGRPLGWYALQAVAAQPPASVTAAKPSPPASRRSRGALRFALLPLVAALAALVPWNRVHFTEPALPASMAVNDAQAPDGIVQVADEAAQPSFEGDAERADAAEAPSGDPDARAESPRPRQPATSPVRSRAAAEPRRAAHGKPARNGASHPAVVPAAPAAAATAQAAAHAMRGTHAAAREPHAHATGKIAVRLAVRPWGEVRIEGRSAVLTPPVKTLQLPPGRYAVTIRNGTLPPVRRELVVAEGAGPITLAHDFTCVAVRDQVCPEAPDTASLSSSRLRPRSSQDRMDSLLSVAGRAGRPDLAAASQPAPAASLEHRALASR
jgi:hypothetical protein